MCRANNIFFSAFSGSFNTLRNVCVFGRDERSRLHNHARSRWRSAVHRVTSPAGWYVCALLTKFTTRVVLFYDILMNRIIFFVQVRYFLITILSYFKLI